MTWGAVGPVQIAGRLACGVRGHAWGDWIPASKMPTKARECARCHKREVYWLGVTGDPRRALHITPDDDQTLDQATPPLTGPARAGVLRAVARAVSRSAAAITNALLACYRAICAVLPHLRYARYVARHKWFVYYAGMGLRAPWWRLVIHDYSKLSRAEWGPYVRTFYRPDLSREQIQAEFDAAWLHHQHHNPHHWQSWVLRLDSGECKVLEMPEPLVREMVADWWGASRAITGRWGAREWYASGAGAKMMLHPATRKLAERLLTEESLWAPPVSSVTSRSQSKATTGR